MCNLGEGLAERWMEKGIQQTRTIFRLFMSGESESTIAEKTGKSEQEIHDILYSSEEAWLVPFHGSWYHKTSNCEGTEPLRQFQRKGETI